MSTPLLSAFYDVGDILYQNHKNNQLKTQQFTTLPERRATIGAAVNPLTKNRSVPTGAFIPIGNDNTHTCDNHFIAGESFVREHRKLDRSISEPGANVNNGLVRSQSQVQQQQQNVNSSRYKTELCRPFEESGHCKYGDKCQFAHGLPELRTLSRHPKYKTELCRTFHTIGFCPYGPRCHFIHNEDERKLSNPTPSGTPQSAMINKNHPANMMSSSTTMHQPLTRQSPPPIMDHFSQVRRPSHFVSGFGGSLGSSSESLTSSSASDSPSLSPTFWGNDDVYRDLTQSGAFSSASSASCSSTSSSPVFDYPADLPASRAATCTLANLLAPLNVNTTQMQQNPTSSDINILSQQLNAMMNLNQCNSNHNVFDHSTWDLTPAPPSPPDSISGDSVGSHSSTGSSGANIPTCGSPLDISKSLRLPIFNQLSQED